jgi:transcriptional regulator with XRE-family HTH domain
LNITPTIFGGDTVLNVEKFRLLRMSKGLSQKQLAEFLNINPSYLNQIEKGKRTPSLNLLIRIAKALEKNVKDFF